MYRTRSIDMDGERCDWEQVSAESPAGAALAHVRGELRRGALCLDEGRASVDVEVQELNGDGVGIWERRWCCIVGVWLRREALGNVGSVLISARQPLRRHVTLTPDRGGMWRVEGEDWGDVEVAIPAQRAMLEGLRGLGRREGSSGPAHPPITAEQRAQAITSACTDAEVVEVVRLLRAHLRRHREGAPVLPMMGEE